VSKAKRLRLIEETGIPRDEWIDLARQWCSNEMHREIFIRTCLDEISLEQAAAEFALCSKRIGQIKKEVLYELRKRTSA